MYFVRVSSSSEVGSVKTYVENMTKIWGVFSNQFSGFPKFPV